MMKRLQLDDAGSGRRARAHGAVLGLVHRELVLPDPPDVMLVPMVLARRLKAWAYASIATIGSVIGGAAGCDRLLLLRGDRAADPAPLWQGRQLRHVRAVVQRVGRPDPHREGHDAVPLQGADDHRQRDPHAAGALHAGEHRGARVRFYLIAGLLYWFGEPVRHFIEKHLNLVTTAFVVLLVAGFLAVRFVF